MHQSTSTRSDCGQSVASENGLIQRSRYEGISHDKGIPVLINHSGILERLGCQLPMSRFETEFKTNVLSIV